MNQTVWIARHGNRLDFVYPEWFNTAERRYDPPLSADGFIQAQKLGKRLKNANISHIFTSPFLRAIQTAHEVAKILELPIKLEAGLGEWHNPEWMTETPQIHPQELLESDYPPIDSSYTSRIVPEYPETEEVVIQRSAEIVKKLVNEYSDDILIVGHSTSVLGATWGLIPGNPQINTSLCCLVKLVRENANWKMELNGDTSHLSQKKL
jgi:broad specificity phosphatase PhoE